MNDNALHVARVLSAMEHVCPRVGRDIAACLDRDVVDYARRFHGAVCGSPSRLGAWYRARLGVALGARARALYPESGGEPFWAPSTVPVVLTAPHCQLYTDRMAFWSYLMAFIAAREHGACWLPVFNTSTVTLQERAGLGPAWLTTSAGAVNVTNLGSSRLSSVSVCAAGAGVHFNAGAVRAAAERTSPSEASRLVKLASCLESGGDTLAERTDRANVHWLTSLSDQRSPRPVLFSEPLVSQLMIAAIEARDPIVNAFLFEPERRARLATAFERAQRQPYRHFLSNTTVHFWGLRQGKIRKLTLVDDNFIELDDPGPQRIAIVCERSAVLDALSSGRLVPNLFWCFLLTGILPGFAAIGGTRQIGYLPSFVDILCNALEGCAGEEAELLDSLSALRLSLWGAKVLECMSQPLETLAALRGGSELDQLHERCRSVTLREATNHLGAFRDHPLWSRF
jgi:hypothetical protein